jgi:hypothetical protein
MVNTRLNEMGITLSMSEVKGAGDGSAETR